MPRLLLALLLGPGCSEYKIQSAAETDAGVERAPQILTSPERVSVGMVEAGDVGEEVVQLTNIGDADLLVTSLSLSGDLAWTIATEGTGTLEPGAATAVILEWEAMVDTDGVDTLAVASNDPMQPVVEVPLSWQLPEEEKPPGELLITPPVFDFGTVDVGEVRSTEFTLQNIGGEPLTITRIMLDSSSSELGLDASSPALPLTLVTGETEQATVFYAPVDGEEDAATITAIADVGEQTADIFGTGKDFEGFSTGWYVWDPRIPVPTTTDPSYVVDHHGDEDTYFYENSGMHGMTDSSDIEGDFAILRDYVISNAGEPIVPEGPFTWGESSVLDAHNEASFTYFLCDFYLPEDADPSTYAVESLAVDDGLRIIVNGHIIGHQKISEPSGTWALEHAIPGAVNTLLVILVDDAAVHKGIASLSFLHDGVLVEG